MKLGGKHIVAPDRRREGFSVRRASGYDGGIGGFGKEAVNEIGIIAVLNVTIERAGRVRNLKLIPADLRNLETVLFSEANHPAREYFQAGGATVEFLAFL